MQAVAKRASVSPSPKVLLFRIPMAGQAPIPSEHVQPPASNHGGGWWQQHGTTAAWVAIGITALIGLANLSSTWYFRHVDAETKLSDDHIGKVVEERFKPLNRDIFEDKLGKVGDKIDKLTDKVQGLSERVAHLEGPLTKRVSDLETHTNQQASIAKLIDPSRILAIIRAEIQTAETNQKVLPVSDLLDYKNAIQALPASAHEYWTTVAAIINYQSLINQMSGEAPDPRTVSAPCGGLTEGFGGHNYISGFTVSQCVVDLDSAHNALVGIIFKDSVIRYHGGKLPALNVTFVNCAFVLDLPTATPPAHPAFLLSILNSPDQKVIKISTAT
jgi:hypothetical protein